MELSFKQIDEITVVKIDFQELNYPVIHDFKRQITQLFDEKKFNLALNMSDVIFMDRMGIGTLITLRNRLMQEKGYIGMFNISDQVKKTLDITALHKIFLLYDSEEDAVDGLKKELLS